MYPGGILPKKVGWEVALFPKPLPFFYDQNMRFLRPYLHVPPGQIFDILFMAAAAGIVAINLSYYGLLLTVILMKK